MEYFPFYFFHLIQLKMNTKSNNASMPRGIVEAGWQYLIQINKYNNSNHKIA